MRDFTSSAYRALLEAAAENYRVEPMRALCGSPGLRNVLTIRHDVDRRPQLTLRCARIAAEVGVRGTFYFRIPYTFQPSIIRELVDLGHEVGYHYEVLTKSRGDMDKALCMFADELELLREVAAVDTASMHGAPLGRWNNLDIWNSATPEEFGLQGEAYVSIDWSDTFYVTDTGRGWNRPGVSVRDVAGGRGRRPFADTTDLISSLRGGDLPDRVVVNVHPERWVDSAFLRMHDSALQWLKNRVKAVVVRHSQ